MLRKIALSALFVVFISPTFILAQAQLAEIGTGTRPKAGAPELSYRIGPGDLLDVRVFGHPEMGVETRVSSLGQIRVPFIGEVQAACLTEAQLAEAITEKLKKYLRAPQIDVFVKDYQSQPVAVIGAVSRPGRFQMQRRLRLFELLAQAGGAHPGAGNTIHLIRSDEYDFCSMKQAAQAETPAAANGDDGLFKGTFIAINLQELLTGSPKANIYVEPGDIVSVPEAEQVFITGGVMRPGPLPLKDTMTLTEAIGQAGGFYPDAAKNRIKVSRQVAGSQTRKEEIYDFEAIEKRKAKDIVLQPNDLVEVPSSTAKSLGRGLLGIVAPTVSQLPLRVIRPY